MYLKANIPLTDEFLASQIRKDRKHLWHLSAPRSGSTWVTTMLGNILKYKVVPLVPSFDRREQEIDLRTLAPYTEDDIFSPHQHCRASEMTISIMQRFNIKPIVQIRDIFDTVMSLKDYIGKGNLNLPMAYINREYNYLSDEEQIDFVIDMVLPWYFNFLGTWFEYQHPNEKDNKVHYIIYESLVEDTLGTIKGILEYIDEKRDEEELNSIIEQVGKMNTEKNIAKVGRGVQLNDSQREKIIKISEYYSNIDFSPVGIEY